jgi:hypothetical protein
MIGMDKRLIAAFGIAALAVLPGCPRDADTDDTVWQDTMVVESVDTIRAPMEVPVQDTIIETVEHDTIRGEAPDTL